MNSFKSIYSADWEYQEAEVKDIHGRHRHFSSPLRNIFQPALSNQIFDLGFRPYYPGGKKFAVCISHDIDYLFKEFTLKTKLTSCVKRHLAGDAFQRNYFIDSLRRKKIFYDYDLDLFLNLHRERNINSSYYFLALESYEEDYNYSLNQISDQLNKVLKEGNEIGLHGGHKAYCDLDKILSEKHKLESVINNKVVGYRNHFLKMNIPDTWKLLSNAGFIYDTTYGFPDCVGFRNGLCYPFSPFDPVDNKFLDIVEVPLVVMEVTFLNYMKLTPNDSFKLVVKLIQSVKACGGVFTLLWHNNFITGEMAKLYVRLLDYLKAEDPWFATTQQVTEWWKNEKLLEKSHSIISSLMDYKPIA